MAADLPFAGYTWSFTQHAVGLEATTLFDLLACASVFEGRAVDRDRINDLLIERNVLTENVREGRVDAWRDYQQILPELGLIVSTGLSDIMIITPLGHQFLAGAIGYSELMTLQGLRFQYPNGQKRDIQSRLRTVLDEAGIAVPGSMPELMSAFGVLIKPGLLIAQVLVELLDRGERPELSIDEIQACLIPIRANSDYELAVRDVLYCRSRRVDCSTIYPHVRRNVQDWRRFLTLGQVFDKAENGIRLSDWSVRNIDSLKAYIDSTIEEWWVPRGFDNDSYVTWFGYFGHIPSSSSVLFQHQTYDRDYLATNYVAGTLEDDISVQSRLTTAERLRGFALRKRSGQSRRDQQNGYQCELSEQDLSESQRRSIEKRLAQTRLHEDLVDKLSNRFENNGATVLEDPNGVDILSIWPDLGELLVEVKTVSPIGAQNRIRLAIGQIMEYSYRRHVEGHVHDRAIAIDQDLPGSHWIVEMLTEYLEIGLLCEGGGGSSIYSPEDFVTKDHWL